eukprot:gene23774-25336_t
MADGKNGYGVVSIALHWLGAAAVIGVWLLGDRIEDAPRGPERIVAQDLHYGVAFLALAILLPRLLWRFGNWRTPVAQTNSALLDLVAKIVKWGLIACIVIMIISGPLDVWTGRRPEINVFGTLIASPFAFSPEVASAIHKIVGPVHVICSKVIFVLVALHVLGALKHLVIDRDGVFGRMLWPAK